MGRLNKVMENPLFRSFLLFSAFRAVYGTVILVVTLFLATNDNTPFWYSIIFLLFSMVFSRILFKFIKSRWQKDQTDVVT
ncbi:MAG: hypothetical protein CMA81_00635 [Euryarchaeota archaeon]|nr:hypothetical protein [Euryarchaeota archaeon]